jgi:uncharacterized protein YbaP (TraB family)
MMDAWRSGNTGAMERLLTRGFRDFPQLYSQLTVERNRRWIGPVEKLLHDDQDYLVIVGAFHLVGKDGLLDLLAHRGYQITQH